MILMIKKFYNTSIILRNSISVVCRDDDLIQAKGEIMRNAFIIIELTIVKARNELAMQINCMRRHYWNLKEQSPTAQILK